MSAQNDINPFEIELFYDGGCPLCAREINWLRRCDKAARIKFTDIDGSDFDADAQGKSIDELMAQMHGRLSDGTWLQGVEVFRRTYSAVGFRRLVFISRLPGISQALQAGYWLFAKYRRRLTGRCVDGACSRKLQPDANKKPRQALGAGRGVYGPEIERERPGGPARPST